MFARETPLVLMDTREAVERQGGNPIGDSPTVRRQQAPANVVRRLHLAVPATKPAWRDTKVILLTSGRTASAAEHLALSLKRTGRATLVGETTRGAGHYGGMARLPGGYGAFVPVGRTFDPDTGQGWEGTGVAPDVQVPAAEALNKALELAGVDPAKARKPAGVS
jgi:C-terminal processing protease CtpA/Prc